MRHFLRGIGVVYFEIFRSTAVCAWTMLVYPDSAPSCDPLALIRTSLLRIAVRHVPTLLPEPPSLRLKGGDHAIRPERRSESRT